MKEGSVVLTPLPQKDGRIKNRPAILLRRMPPFTIACYVVSAPNYSILLLVLMTLLKLAIAIMPVAV